MTTLPAVSFETALEKRSIHDVANDIKARYGNVEITNTDTYNLVCKGIAEARSVRLAVEEQRKVLKADALAFGREVDSQAKQITAVIQPVEDALKAKKQVVDDIKARKKAEKALKEAKRVQGIQDRINVFLKAQVDIVGKSAIQMVEILVAVESAVIDDSFQEFREQAEAAKNEAITKIGLAIAEQDQREQEDESRRLENERLEKVRKEQEAEAARLVSGQKAIEAAKAYIELQKREAEIREEAKHKAEAELKERQEREASEAKENENLGHFDVKVWDNDTKPSEKDQLEVCIDLIYNFAGNHKMNMKDISLRNISEEFQRRVYEACSLAKDEIEKLS